ncbi:MAG: lamin tail domain-containing protein [Fodinibius sp.]|nr:lamin tail domain-containing protein [Fodinibius sp.]
MFGNPADIDTSFTYYEVTPTDSGDVAINEFMAAPPSGSSEYVEIYNHSEKSLDLQGWTLSDNRGNQDVISSSQFIIPPDSFAVVAPNENIRASYPNIPLVDMGSSFPALNDGGDNISIRDSNGELLDSFTYTSDWVESEIALERRSVDVSAQFFSNWGVAPNGIGTPGSQNEIASDSSPPTLESLMIENSTTLSLTFSEQLDQNSAQNTANFIFAAGPSISSASSSMSTIDLQLDTPLQDAQNYQLSIRNVADIFGNTTSLDSSFTYYNPMPVDSGDIAINEFMPAPPSSSSEYVEIYNHSDKSLDLQNWTLSDNGQSRNVVTGSQFIVPPDSFVVIAPDNSLESEFPDIAMVVMSNFPALNNGGDAITIRDGNGVLPGFTELTILTGAKMKLPWSDEASR